MDFWLEVITPEVSHPVTIDQVKDALHIDDSDSDTELRLLIASCTKQFERRTKRCMMQRTLRLTTHLAGCEIELPMPPATAIGTIESREDLDDSWVAIDSADYDFNAARSPALVTIDESPVYTRIQYTCGYATASEVDDSWKHAIIQMVTFFYESRGDVANDKWPMSLDALVKSCGSGIYIGFWEAENVV